MTNSASHPFDKLMPTRIIEAIEEQGYACSGSVFALNSYENRVYQVGIEDESEPLIVKFYRPDRWSESQIQEEHNFCFELLNHEVSVVTPIKNHNGQSVFCHGGFWFALFKRRGGYAPELDYKDNLKIMGRLLARMHLIGEKRRFKHRPTLKVMTFGQESIDFVSQEFIPFEHKTNYMNVCEALMNLIQPKLENCHNIRVHGDLHVGNILMRNDLPYLVDFDDSRLAPAIQDIWMLLSGEKHEQKHQMQKIIAAYSEFRTFPYNELKLIESLRTLRMIHHCAWLARRYDDPAFATAFNWFNQDSYWVQHINDLNNQLDAMKRDHE